MIKQNLYPDYFYLAQYDLDTVSDSQPNFFKILIWANTGIELNNFNIVDDSKEFMDKKLCSFIIANLELEKKDKAKFNFTLNTVLYDDDFKNFTQKLFQNSKRKQVNIVEGFSNDSKNELWAIIEDVKSKVLLNIDNDISLKDYLKETYSNDKIYILKALPTLNRAEFEKAAEKIEILNKEKGLSIPLVLEEYTNFVPFNLSNEKVLSRVKMSLNLNKNLITEIKRVSKSSLKI